MESQILCPLQLLDVRLYTVSLERLPPEAPAASTASETDQEASTPSFTITLDTLRHVER